MNATEKRDPNWSQYSNNGDEEIDASFLEVRNALLSLPKESCPAGFEYRLNRRLQGLDKRPKVVGRSWVSGWLGVGFGFACAAVVLLFFMNFNGAAPTTVPMAGTAQQVTSPVAGPASQVDEAVPSTVAQPENSMAASNDTVPLKDDPAHISSDQLHQASGQGDAPINP